MISEPSTLAFDTSPLSCFARAGHLDVLQDITRDHRRVVTRAVLDELRLGAADHPSLREPAFPPWLEHVNPDSLEELRCFAAYVKVLGAGEHDLGESSTLAWVEPRKATAVLDDQTAVNIARDRGVHVKRSLALVATGVRRQVLDATQAVHVVNDLIELGGAFFPCDGSTFMEWAHRQGLLKP